MIKRLGTVVSIVLLVAVAVIIYRSNDQPDATPAPDTTTAAPPEGDDPPTGETRKTQKLIKWVKNAPVRSPRPDDTYDREDWPHWRDADDFGWTKAPNEYCDARQAALARDARTVRVDPDTCEVIAGTWIGPYTGKKITDPEGLDVDHIVPLAAAHRAGADDWSEERRTRYANSPDVVLATSDDANQSKSDQEPNLWLPPDRDAWCDYGQRWATVKHDWKLAYTSRAEKKATINLLAHCPGR